MSVPEFSCKNVCVPASRSHCGLWGLLFLLQPVSQCTGNPETRIVPAFVPGAPLYAGDTLVNNTDA